MSVSVFAIDVVEFDDEVERERYHRLTYELRCPKCQNQNLIDSNSQISQDLRREVARLIHEGKNDEEIRTQMVALYGDFILYRPPVQSNTVVLWLGPVVMMALGLLIFGFILIKRMKTEILDDEEDSESSDDSGILPGDIVSGEAEAPEGASEDQSSGPDENTNTKRDV
ncbi:MAG: cytochrome c-type biogenesis protein CcmH [Agarilytica sp.]